MTLFFRTLWEEIKRVVASKPFFLCLLAYLALSVITIAQEIPYFHSGNSIMYIWKTRDYLGVNSFYLLFAAIPGSLGFCFDYHNKFYRYIVLKSSKPVYTLSKAITCIVSSILFINLAEWLMIFALTISGFPLTDGLFADNLGVYNVFAAPEKVWFYFFIVILLKSLCACFFSVLALWVSTKITNLFVVISTPLLCYEILNIVFSELGIPSLFHITEISKGRANILDDPALSFLYSICIFAGLTLLFSVLFFRSCKRRMTHD